MSDAAWKWAVSTEVLWKRLHSNIRFETASWEGSEQSVAEHIEVKLWG